MKSPIGLLQSDFEASFSSYCVGSCYKEVKLAALKNWLDHSVTAILVGLTWLILTENDDLYYFSIILIKPIQKSSFHVLLLKSHHLSLDGYIAVRQVNNHQPVSCGMIDLVPAFTRWRTLIWSAVAPSSFSQYSIQFTSIQFYLYSVYFNANCL